MPELRKYRTFVSCCAAALVLVACAAVKDTGQLLDKDMATDSFDGRYPGFNDFLNRVSKRCNNFTVGNDSYGDNTVSGLIRDDANMIDALSRLYEAKISRADFSAFLGGWYAGSDANALSDCIFAQLPNSPKP